VSGEGCANWTTLLSDHVRARILEACNPKNGLEQFTADVICSATCVLGLARRIELGLDHNDHSIDMSEIREIIKVNEVIRKGSIIAIAAKDNARAAMTNEALRELDAQLLSADFKLERRIKTASRSVRSPKRASGRQRRAP
jgi:hypothetical protein